MFGRFKPREEKFFVLFSKAAELVVSGAEAFRVMLDDMSQLEAHAAKIKDIEHQCDEVTHETIALLHKTFITPLDRDDIHRLICKLDDVLDFTKAASERMFLYDMKEAPIEAVTISDICVSSAKTVKKAIDSIENLTNPGEILKHCIEIHRLENDADYALRTSIARMFKEEPDIRKLIMYKEIIELLEAVTDRCEDVANIVEGIVLEYA